MTVSAIALLVAMPPASQTDPGALLQPNRPPATTLTLPPVGTELGIFGPWERGNVAKGKEPAIEAKANDVQIKQFTVTKATDPYGTRGLLQVDVILSREARDHYVDIYVSGYYAGINGELEGLKNVGRRPAYEFVRLDYANQNRHPAKEPNRRYIFQIPNVLPAKVRAELYQIVGGKPARLLAKKESGFDTDWKDYGVLSGFLFGERGKAITRAKFLLLPGTESVNVRIPAMKPIRPDDFSNDVNISLRTKSLTEIDEAVNRNIEGRERNWKATYISSGPVLLDRDFRNNEYWPYLANGGYLEIPPIRLGNAPLVKYQ